MVLVIHKHFIKRQLVTATYIYLLNNIYKSTILHIT